MFLTLHATGRLSPSPLSLSPPQGQRSSDDNLGGALTPASCIDNASTAAANRDAVRLGLITFASRDLLEPCLAWMRYYTAVEHIRPGDIYVIKAAANEELGRCFRLLPRRNLIEMPPFGYLRSGVLTADVQPTSVLTANASLPASTYSEWHRLAAFATVQGELFATGYTHTLIVDQDEFVMAEY